jgi:hypothetical protein
VPPDGEGTEGLGPFEELLLGLPLGLLPPLVHDGPAPGTGRAVRHAANMALFGQAVPNLVDC